MNTEANGGNYKLLCVDPLEMTDFGSFVYFWSGSEIRSGCWTIVGVVGEREGVEDDVHSH